MGAIEDTMAEWFPPRTTPTQEQIDKNMAATLELQHTGMVQHGKPPFASILVAPDHETILVKYHNVSYIRHAESCVALTASDMYPPGYLWQCTMYTTWEPCAMCSGTAYWANIGRVIFAASVGQLLEVTGANNPINFTANDDCCAVLQGGQKKIEVSGPVPGWDRKVMQDADWFWSKTQARMDIAAAEKAIKAKY